MRTVPTQCRARFYTILEISGELIETWINGNRKDVVVAFDELGPSVSRAVLTQMMMNSDDDTAASLTSYFMEVA